MPTPRVHPSIEQIVVSALAVFFAVSGCGNYECRIEVAHEVLNISMVTNISVLARHNMLDLPGCGHRGFLRGIQVSNRHELRHRLLPFASKSQLLFQPGHQLLGPADRDRYG